MEIRTETVKMERRTNRVRKNGKKNVQSQENKVIQIDQQNYQFNIF